MKKIFGITGEIGSGKDTVAKFFIDKYGAKMFRFSDILKDICLRLNLEINTRNLQGVSTALRSFVGENCLASAMYNDCLKSDADFIVISGIRRFADFENLKKIDGFKLIYVDADIETRYKRTLVRGEKIDDTQRTFEDFKKDNEQECEIEIKNLKNISDYVLDNSSDLNNLVSQIEKIF